MTQSFTPPFRLGTRLAIPSSQAALRGLPRVEQKDIAMQTSIAAVVMRPLARHFLDEVLSDATDIDEPVRDFVRDREYPGNVRELRHLVLRMALRHVGDGPLTIGDVPEDERPTAASSHDADDALATAVRLRLEGGMTLKEISAAAADAAIAVALADARGSVPQAARRLGVTPRALQLRRAQGRLPAPLPAELDLHSSDP